MIWFYLLGFGFPGLPLSLQCRRVAGKQAGGIVKFTVYPEAGHDSWTESYANPELYDWLLQQKRAK